MALRQFSGVPTSLLFLWVPLPNKASWFVSTCVSLDNSFLIDRQSPLSGPGISSLPATLSGPKAFSLVENSGNHECLHFHHGSDTRQFQN